MTSNYTKCIWKVICIISLICVNVSSDSNSSNIFIFPRNASLYHPFKNFQNGPRIIYIIGALCAVTFVCIKYLSEWQFHYCRLVGGRKCNLDSSNPRNRNKKCQMHRTTAGNILPESALLITSGIIPALILLKLEVNLKGSLDPNFVFNALLVPIVMGAAWNTDKIVFYRNLGTILLFAVVGTILNATILAPLFFFGSKSRWGIFDVLNMDLIDSGMYATLICAVDPVAVLSVFESMHIDKLVYNLVFGESLLNDGVAVVFYRAFNEMKTISNVDFFHSLFIILLYFVYAFGISLILAFVMAIVISLASRIFYKYQPMEFVVILSLNHLTYLMGDAIKGSGIISLFFCVLMQRQYVQANLSATSNTILSQVLSQLSLLSEGVIYIMMGLTSFTQFDLLKNTDIRFSAFLIFACYISRFIVVYLLGTVANFFRKEKLDYKKHLFILAHGGLRGAIGFLCVLSLGGSFKNRSLYLSATTIMVFFSVYILGVSIKPLVNLLHIPIEDSSEKYFFSNLQEKLCDRTKEGIETIISSSSIRSKWEIWYRHKNNEYLKKYLMNSNTLERNFSHSSLLKTFRYQNNSEFNLHLVNGKYSEIDLSVGKIDSSPRRNVSFKTVPCYSDEVIQFA